MLRGSCFLRRRVIYLCHDNGDKNEIRRAARQGGGRRREVAGHTLRRASRGRAAFPPRRGVPALRREGLLRVPGQAGAVSEILARLRAGERGLPLSERMAAGRRQEKPARFRMDIRRRVRVRRVGRPRLRRLGIRARGRRIRVDELQARPAGLLSFRAVRARSIRHQLHAVRSSRGAAVGA